MTEWVVVTLLIVVVFSLVGDGFTPASLGSLLAGGVVYLGFGAVLAKFGYQRSTLKAMRAQQQAKIDAQNASASSARSVRPAPTKRTSTGPQHARNSSKKKRK